MVLDHILDVFGTERSRQGIDVGSYKGCQLWMLSGKITIPLVKRDDLTANPVIDIRRAFCCFAFAQAIVKRRKRDVSVDRSRKQIHDDCFADLCRAHLQ